MDKFSLLIRRHFSVAFEGRNIAQQIIEISLIGGRGSPEGLTCGLTFVTGHWPFAILCLSFPA